MFEKLFAFFPANIHPLILVSDPDDLLADEVVLSMLLQRGFQVVRESDPVLFRYRIEQLKPFELTAPVLLVANGALEELPYDLWEQGHYVHLALHEFFPNLAYPIVRELTPLHRAHLWDVEQPKERLGEQRTIQFLLEQVFRFSPNLIKQQADFILWLDEFHQSLGPFPPAILEYVLAQLNQSASYQELDLKEILQDRDAYRRFIQTQWHDFLETHTGNSLREKPSEYILHFETDQKLQDVLPRLLRSGSLVPVQMATQSPMPAWVVPGILMQDEDPRPRRMTELATLLNETLSTLTTDSRWDEWKTIAYQWAELTTLRNELGISAFEEKDLYKEIQSRLDAIFTDWLAQRYSSLAIPKLPIPHHVHHVPHYINYLRSQGAVQKAALVVMDGMSLTDWFLMKRAWQSRQPDWHMNESLVLAQIPTITAISRYLLISGLRPADFYTPNISKMTETKAWNTFWMREGLPENAIDLIALKLENDDPAPEITNPRLQALCLIERQLDEIMHGSMLGAMDHQSTVNLWLSQNGSGKNSGKLERVIDLLLDEDFTVFLASDHGHCESYGIGKPSSEGLMVQSRGRRARLYSDRRSAEQIQLAFSDTILWENDGLLPKDIFALLPNGRQAFAEHNEILITHGGITIDEIVVPLVEITKNDN